MPALAPAPAPDTRDTRAAASPRQSIWLGVLAGLVPLAILVLLGALTFTLTALARQLSLSQGFFFEQRAVVAVLGGGLALSASIYALACVRALRRARTWQQLGSPTRAAGMLCSLGLSALVVVLPLLLAIFLPQHPAL